MSARSPGPTWQRADGVLRTDLAGGTLLFDADAVRVHQLNTSAALIWDALERPGTTADVISAVTAALGTEPPGLADDVRTTLDRLGAEELVHPTPAARADAPVGGGHDREPLHPLVPRPPQGVDPDVALLDGASTLGPFGALDLRVTIRLADPALASWLARVLRPLALRANALDPGMSDHRIDVVPGGRGRGGPGGVVLIDGVVASAGDTDRQLAALLVWHVNHLVCGLGTRRLQLHAAVAVIDGRAVVLPARMNAGKSTLVAGLVRAGAGYLSDECAALDASLTVAPYPRSITLEAGSWPVLPELEPDAPHDDEDRFTHAKWYVDPEDIRPGATVTSPVPLGAIVLPTYRPDTPTELLPVDPLEAAAELAAHAFNLATLGAAGLEILRAAVETVPVQRLSVHDLTSGVAAVHAAIATA